MSLIKEFQTRTANFKESKRLIERGKRLMRPERIILLGDFYDYAVKPLLLAPDSYVAKYFLEGQEDARKLLKLWIADGGILTYPVPKNLLERDCPEFTYASLFGAEVNYIAEIADKMQRKGQAGEGYAEMVLKNHDRWLRRRETYPAVHLGEALKSMDWKIQHELQGIEWLALVSGEGRIIADFWNDVNNLRDYSRHFPDHDDYTGKKPPPRRPFRLAPVVGAGWNPPVPDQI